MTTERSVEVSPRHRVGLDEDYLPMIDRPPREDFVVRVLSTRTAGDVPLMSAEIVIASAATREKHALAARYPLHFRKTYYPGSLYGDPCRELERQELASRLTGVPEPIGCTRTTFRSCLVPGTPLDRVSDLATEPEESNIARARERSLPTLVGVWHLAEEAFRLLGVMQEGGLTHGDAHLHNFVVCPSPLEVIPIDFEDAVVHDSVDAGEWQRRCVEDRRHLLRLAIYLQCALGRQRGPFAEAALEAVSTLMRDPDRFTRAVEERT